MISDETLNFLLRVTNLCRSSGAIPYSWDAKNRRFLITNQSLQKTLCWLLVQLLMLMFVVVRTIFIKFQSHNNNIASFNFCLSIVFALMLHSLLRGAHAFFPKNFVYLMNCAISFADDYKGKFKSKF